MAKKSPPSKGDSTPKMQSKGDSTPKQHSKGAPSPGTRTPAPSTSHGSIACSVTGDPAAAALYKTRRASKIKKKGSRIGQCSCNPKWWAFTNLFYSVLDLVFSICELVVYTIYTNPFDKSFDVKESEENDLHFSFFLVSIVLHGDCFEILIEIVLNFIGELIYVISSFLFAFATFVEREERGVSRCLAQWFVFTLWIPAIALIPRFVLNVASSSSCWSHASQLFPNANENVPRIAFWIVNLLHFFFMLLWSIHGRLVALNFIHLLREEEQRQPSIRMAQMSGSGDFLSVVPSVTSHMTTTGLDKARRSGGLGGMLPPSHAML